MNDDITWRQENERGFDPKAKFFVEYRKEAKDPFVQLYYETLSCFHVNDYGKALEGMSDKLRQIIMACNERLQISNNLKQEPNIDNLPKDVVATGNCANCGVEFHIHELPHGG